MPGMGIVFVAIFTLSMLTMIGFHAMLIDSARQLFVLESWPYCPTTEDCARAVFARADMGVTQAKIVHCELESFGRLLRTILQTTSSDDFLRRLLQTTSSDDFFSLITCISSMSYWDPLIECSDEIHRILKTGGCAQLVEPPKDIDFEETVQTPKSNLADASTLGRLAAPNPNRVGL